MKRIYSIFLLVVMTVAFTGCDKWDCNGDLDGMWQLTEWRGTDKTLKATKEDKIFYSFQLQMAAFRKNGDEFYIRTLLEANSEQILISKPIIYEGNGHDAVQPMSILSVVGVPEDGIFYIKELTGKSMKLQTKNQETLSFRKY